MKNRPEFHTDPKVVEFLKNVEQRKNSPMPRELLIEKIKNTQELIDAVTEAIHYAKQDLSYSESNFILDQTTTEQRQNLRNLEKELEAYKKEWSELNAKL